MRGAIVVLAVFLLGINAAITQDDQGPTDPKAQKTYREGLEWAHKGMPGVAVDSFKKANKQDGGHCEPCANKIIEYGLKTGDFKAADAAAQQLIVDAKTPLQAAEGHLERGTVQYREGVEKNKTDCYAEADREFQATLAAYPRTPVACFYDGVALARLNRDDAAKAQFAKYLDIAPKTDTERERAQRYIENPELARARLAPPVFDHHARRPSGFPRLSRRQSRPHRLLGDLVRSLPRGPPASSRNRAEIFRRPPRGHEHQPR
jgi:tetratricopeptide (TPR) repeat protein